MIKHINKNQLISYYKNFKPTIESWEELYLSGWCKVENSKSDELIISRYIIDNCFDVLTGEIKLLVDYLYIKPNSILIKYGVDNKVLNINDLNTIPDYRKYDLVSSTIKLVEQIYDMKPEKREEVYDIINKFIC